MPSSIHFINRQVGIGREGLSHLGGGRYRSCCWILNGQEIEAIIGGWIYLHETKSAPSAFGDKILAVEPGIREQAAYPEGFAIIFDAPLEAQGQAWRGADHALAYRSGLVEPDLPHEIGPR